MLLAIDVGNTNVVLGVFKERTLVQSWRIATLRERTSDELGILMLDLLEHRGMSRGDITGIVIGSVVPPLTSTIVALSHAYFDRRPLVIDSTTNTGMPVLYDNPLEVGADRIVNSVAAYELCGRESQRALICVDFGTATTFDAISSRGEYLGGAICPGIQISADALFQRAARLPRIDVRKPQKLVGRTTVQSMQAGLFFGYVGLVEGIVTRMSLELGGTVGCLATGGLAPMIAPETHLIERIEPDLTLHGLRMVWERNQ